MSEFSVGDVVILVRADNPEAKKYIGQECKIVGLDCIWEYGNGSSIVYILDFPTLNGKAWGALASQLMKKRPPEEYDGYQTTKWDTVPWVPKELVRA